MCRSILDHDYTERRLISAYVHPTQGRTLVYQVRCTICGQTRQERERPQQSTRAAFTEVPA